MFDNQRSIETQGGAYLEVEMRYNGEPCPSREAGGGGRFELDLEKKKSETEGAFGIYVSWGWFPQHNMP